MGVREIWQDLEQPPCGCDILDMDKLLRGCGYDCQNDGDTLTYEHGAAGWPTLTFPAKGRNVSCKAVVDILEMLRPHATKARLIP